MIKIKELIAFMTKYEIFVTYISPALTILIASLNIWFVYLVFKFNRKMGQSKLSVSPITYSFEQSPELSSLNNTYELWKLNWIDEIRGLPISFKDRVNDENKRGVPSDARFDPQLLTVKLKNKGELASTNIKVVLLFKAYGSKIKYFKNETTHLNYKSFDRKLFSKKKIVIKVPYIAADDEIEFQILDLSAQFRESELILCKIKANGHTYFKEKLLSKIFNRVIIHHYKHPFLGGAADGSDINKLIGLGYEEKEWVDPYKSERFGGRIWLRNLFVGWLK